MSAADDKQIVIGVIDCLADLVNGMRVASEQIREVQADVMILGLSEANHDVASAVTMTEQTKMMIDKSIHHSFILRQIITRYRDAL